MRTFLFSWKPRPTDLESMAKRARAIRNGQQVGGRWSCGNRKELPIGSRFFLIRLGKSPKGFVAVGTTKSNPYVGDHWLAAGKNAIYVRIQFTDIREEPLIGWAELNKPPFNRFRWGTQSSGIEIPEDISNELWSRWSRRTKIKSQPLPDECQQPKKLKEGATTTITVNAYERNPAARAACIAKYGYQCAVCDIILEKKYGDLGKTFIHVHHLIPLSKIGESYEIDAENDLRPVCPNCHAMLHRKDPPLTIGSLRKRIGK